MLSVWMTQTQRASVYRVPSLQQWSAGVQRQTEKTQWGAQLLPIDGVLHVPKLQLIHGM
jgi:hypothetical protein